MVTRYLTRRDILKVTGASLFFSGFGNILGAQGNPGPANPTPPQEYTLPDLPYGLDALEPHYSAQTLQIHHDKHHATYVKGLNQALEQLSQARQSGDNARIQFHCEQLAFHGSGHVLHSIFWNSMTPGGAQPSESFNQALQQSFGSPDAFMKQFTAAAEKVEASGWAVLAYEPMRDRLLILQAGKHQNLTIWGVTPLLVCDVWEHAYYLQYQNKRPDWIAAFMKIANWKYAEDQLKRARQNPQKI